MRHFNRFLALASLAIASPVALAFDSVAVFYKAEKVVVLINEAGEEGRLKDLMDLFGSENSLLKTSEDQSFKMDCGRNERAATCTFRFTPSSNLPSSEVRLFKRGAEGHARFVRNSNRKGSYIKFENSNGDQFWIDVKGDHITFRANKFP